MGELIIRIDQESGALLGVVQKSSPREIKAIVEKAKKEGEELPFDEEQLEKGILPLKPMGNISSNFPKEVLNIKTHRDTFDRIVSIPVEFWEKKGNTICTVNWYGHIFQCWH